MPTWCLNCDFVHGATREKEPWHWRCVKVPTRPGFGFVHPDHSPDPPYEKCSRHNTHGECPDFQPARQLKEAAA